MRSCISLYVDITFPEVVKMLFMKRQRNGRFISSGFGKIYQEHWTFSACWEKSCSVHMYKTKVMVTFAVGRPHDFFFNNVKASSFLNNRFEVLYVANLNVDACILIQGRVIDVTCSLKHSSVEEWKYYLDAIVYNNWAWTGSFNGLNVDARYSVDRYVLQLQNDYHAKNHNTPSPAGWLADSKMFGAQNQCRVN